MCPLLGIWCVVFMAIVMFIRDLCWSFTFTFCLVTFSCAMCCFSYVSCAYFCWWSLVFSLFRFAWSIGRSAPAAMKACSVDFSACCISICDFVVLLCALFSCGCYVLFCSVRLGKEDTTLLPASVVVAVWFRVCIESFHFTYNTIPAMKAMKATHDIRLACLLLDPATRCVISRSILTFWRERLPSSSKRPWLHSCSLLRIIWMRSQPSNSLMLLSPERSLESWSTWEEQWNGCTDKMTGIADQTTLNMVYNIADLINKIRFVLACWSWEERPSRMSETGLFLIV